MRITIDTDLDPATLDGAGELTAHIVIKRGAGIGAKAFIVDGAVIGTARATGGQLDVTVAKARDPKLRTIVERNAALDS